MIITLKHKTVKIRKEHRCLYCYRRFPIGSEMKYWVGVYDMDFFHGYNCLTCNKIFAAWEQKYGHDGDGYYEGTVKESLKPNQTPEQYLETITNQSQ